MSKGNPFQDQINADGFDQKLMQNDSDAWGVLLEYVREQVKARSKDHQEVAEEYTGQACTHIVYKLKDFQKRGLLSAYIDKLIRTAVANPDVKRLMTATSRFLMATDKLPGPYSRELREIVRRRPPVECAMLLDFMDGQKFDWSDWRRQRLWYDARRGLLHDPDFDYLLHTLAREGHCQANTLLYWLKIVGEPEEDSPGSDEDGDEIDFPDPVLTPWEDLLRREVIQQLLECLEKLRQRSGDQHQVIERKFYYDESTEQIAALLGASKAAVRKRLERGLKSLHECMAEDKINEGSDERHDL